MRTLFSILLIFLFAILFLFGDNASSHAQFARGKQNVHQSAEVSSSRTVPKETKRLPNHVESVTIHQEEALPDRAYLIIIQCEMIEYQHLGEEITFQHLYLNQEIENGDVLTLTGTQVKIETIITDEEKIPDVGSGSVVFDIGQDTGTVSQTITIQVDEVGGTRFPKAYAVWEITYTLTPYIP